MPLVGAHATYWLGELGQAIKTVKSLISLFVKIMALDWKEVAKGICPIL